MLRLLCASLLMTIATAALAEDPARELRAGIIGLDTSHCIAFAKLLNDAKVAPELANCRVVAAYPKGSPDIESSVSRVPGYTAEMKKLQVEIVDSIEELVKRVDVVFLETNDGRPHLEQLLPVLKGKKPCFIDKPVAGTLTDAVAIYRAAEKAGVPIFSASGLRFGKLTQEARAGSLGKVKTCETISPASKEKTHPELFWYGIHGVESLFTVMGTGCVSVRHEVVDGKIRVTGVWEGGRTGIFQEGSGYSGKASGDKGEGEVGKFDGYRPLLVEIVKFFRSGKPPVSSQETIELYAFMEAADESRRQGGKEVTLASVLKEAEAAATARLKELER